MPHILALAVLLGLFSATAGAQVIRCVNAAGNVSYTDQQCPSNARESRQVLGAEATTPQPEPVRRAAVPEVVAPAPAPARAGPGPAEQRAVADRADAQQREFARLQEAERVRETERVREMEQLRRAEDYTRNNLGGYPYPGTIAPRAPAGLQDMRPQIRNCDAGGCNDTQGNTYNRSSGALDRYRSIDGKNCRPVGTTVVCQ
ncbi:DUF4124 domain-containing protein [Variovorax sp. PAMC 28711]|uniref:DUF4124 domain-containing protein n=1 Tax=Variovorax sp. PAMC 28711 TaxID=1795631 RepID=UPI00078D6526|nr:DUF4124 domain-containing protein [Variovorax sp. PAMC 28711]AMM23618.1 hypothetical protein AX767_04125 [Variovorax sp. PAMC 28711]